MPFVIRIFDEEPEEFEDWGDAEERLGDIHDDMQEKHLNGYSMWVTGKDRVE